MSIIASIERYNILISCPSDIDEIDDIKQSIDSFNKNFGFKNNIILDVQYWRDDMFPKSNSYPQDSINNILVDQCDIAVALIWTKVGTPTKNYESGTIEEIERLIKGNKQVFMYFCEKNVKPSEIDVNQLDKVKKFKEKYKSKNLYWVYDDKNYFSNLFERHLNLYFEDLVKENHKKEVAKSMKMNSSEITNEMIEPVFAIEIDQSLDDYIKMFEGIYEPIQNVERDFNHILARLLEAIAECSQYVNKSNLKGLADNLPKVFSWYSSLVYKSGINVKLSNATWKKFPNVCPYCLRQPCSCSQGRKNLANNSKKLEELAQENNTYRPMSLYEWQKMFSKIYPRNAEGYDQKIIFAHLIEELGEASEAFRIRYYAPTALESELADIFTWIVGMANFVDSQAKDGNVPGYQDYNLAENVYKKYPIKCSDCKSNPCTCVSRHSKQRISELNVVYSDQIIDVINELGVNFDDNVAEYMKSSECQNLMLEVRKKLDGTEVKEESVKDKIKEILTKENEMAYKSKNVDLFSEKVIAIFTLLLKKVFV